MLKAVPCRSGRKSVESLGLKDTLLQLVRLGIGTSKDAKISKDNDWESVEALAEKQGMLGVVYDGVIRLAEIAENADILPLTVKLRWMGKVIQEYEHRYVAYKKAVADLAAWYHAHGYRMMALKGLACGVDWPRPEHRPYGDIDIYLFGRQKEADDEMVSSFRFQDPSFKVDNSHHHHTVFQWQGFTVENHYDFLNVHHHKSNEDLEALLKSLAHTDDISFCHTDSTDNTDICLPSANFNALYLLRHAMSHFASTGMNLRQLLDWAFFVEKHGEEVDWDWLQGVLKKYGMEKMFDVMNVICVEDLGFQFNADLNANVDVALRKRVLNEILSREFDESTPKSVWKRVPFKYRRWKANAWKHELCFNDSMGSAFWAGVKNHLMKPASI